MLSFLSASPKETYRLGYRLGKIIVHNYSYKTAGDGSDSNKIICLVGSLGIGKTTFVQGLVSGLKAMPSATSPSFKLVNEYFGKLPVYHFDLYRLEGIKDLRNLGYREYFYGQGVTVIEWAEKIKNFWPKEYLAIYFHRLGEKERKINFISQGGKYRRILKKLEVITSEDFSD
ncbi:MAG TPA: tRNA (adenosine(37)-N6)-threonylcarbamoyltransferase complex ATPase subunit type 1 TsaE [Elusimicrobia bacterium]|jgi:tRNA threonylcarbamoyladenosine biosynthesis protein TsaE|nr:tRNA (adenosine(37)-N6)-threonylcarbamoyltransferase complex ATPase subunit type 1 TsaE [Elusimicrobiota bacterium]